jgi:uncharacterized secreted protein with C-terminal beta-propeller domain
MGFSLQSQLEGLEKRQLLSSAMRVWEIKGDLDSLHRNDEIVVRVDPDNHGKLIATIGGEAAGRRGIDSIDVVFVRGGKGNDRIVAQLQGKASKLRVRLDGGKGNDTLIGGAGRDELNGNAGDDLIDGGEGADLVRGGAGKDSLSGGDGSDVLEGNEENDTLIGGWGSDRLVGGPQADFLAGGADGDKLSGNGGNDTLVGGEGKDRLNGGSGKNYGRRESSRDSLAFINKTLKQSRAADAALIRFGEYSAWVDTFIDRAVDQYKEFFGKKMDYGYPVYRYDSARDSVVLFAASHSDALSAAGNSYSETNTQEQGVDEADLSETDGSYIYSISKDQLVITDVSDPNHLRIASRTTIEGSIHGIYLTGDRVTVISQTGGYWTWGGGIRPIGGVIAEDFVGGSSSKQQVKTTVIDVTNRDQPAVASETSLDGSYVSSRMIDGRLYLAVNNWLASTSPDLKLDGESYVYESESEFRERLRSSMAEQMPSFEVTVGGQTSGGSLVNSSNMYIPENDEYASNLTTVALIDPANAGGPSSTTSVVNDGSWETYASADAMYITGGRWNSESSSTAVYKFTLGTTNVTLAATGEVSGTVGDQFAMDEQDNDFRIATSRWTDNVRSSAVSILQQSGEDLNVVGEVNNLAPGESLFAARFIGDMAYLVTSVQMQDPLFAIDVSDATNPVVQGELDIPGFSRYLHPIDDDHLLALGRSENNELQVSLFDVTDSTAPARSSVLEIPTEGWTWSASEWDHLTFQYFPEYGVAAFPVLDESGERLQLVKIDDSGKLQLAGTIEEDGTYSLRGVRIGSNVFAVGEQGISGKSLETGEELGRLLLSDPSGE